MKNISKKITALILSLILAVAVIPLSGINIEAAAVSGDDIVAYARTFIGCSYVSGGTGPDSFDCSGFASYVFAHFGINIPNSTTLIWNDIKSNKETYGTVIDHGSTEKAQAGDLIVWVGHVSIYTSNGNCVEALNSRYGVTEAMPVNSHTVNGMDYYVLHVKGVSGASAKPAAAVITADNTTVKKGEKVTLSWQPVDGVLHYRVECTLWPLPYVDETTTSTSYTFTPGISGAYTVCVYSVNSAGETQSNKLTVKVESDGTSTGGSPTDFVLPITDGIDLSSFKTVIDMIINAFQAFIKFMTNIVSALSSLA